MAEPSQNIELTNIRRQMFGVSADARSRDIVRDLAVAELRQVEDVLEVALQVYKVLQQRMPTNYDDRMKPLVDLYDKFGRALTPFREMRADA